MKKKGWAWKYSSGYMYIQFFRDGRYLDSRAGYSPKVATEWCNYLNERQGLGPI